MNSKIQLKAETVTMGDLIVAITDAALQVARDEDIAYRIAGLPASSESGQRIVAISWFDRFGIRG